MSKLLELYELYLSSQESLKLSNLSLKYNQFQKNKNDLFQAVALLVNQNPESLQNLTATYFEKNLNTLQEIIPLQNGETLEAYLQAFKQGKKSQDHLEIEVLMRALGRPIVVIGLNGFIETPDVLKRVNADTNAEPIFILATDNYYYHALLPEDGINKETLIKYLKHFKDFIEFVTNPASSQYVNDKDEKEQTALHIAAREDDINTVKILLEQNADMSIKDKFKRTPLWNCMNIVPDINIPIVRLLIVAGANLEEMDGGGNTTLHYAVLAGNLHKTMHLLALGASINTKNTDGDTPLKWALTRELPNKPEMLKLLFKKERVIAQDFTGIDIPPNLIDGVIVIGSYIMQGTPLTRIPVTRQMKGFENAITNSQEFAEAVKHHQFNFASIELSIKNEKSDQITAFKETLQKIKIEKQGNVSPLTLLTAKTFAKLSLFATNKTEKIKIDEKIKKLPIELQQIVQEEMNNLAIKKLKSQQK